MRRRRRRSHGAEQHEVHCRLAEPLENEDAEAAAADQGGDRHHADRLHQHDADAGEDHGEGERHVDAGQDLQACQPHAGGRIAHRRIDALQADDGIGDDRQQRIEH